MAKVRNVLFIMCDQLRADHLSCAGHPHLKTPAIDALARRGVLFPRAYVQSGVCGPSRMSYYTGRYMFSHGATWNRVPLSLREKTIGDYLRSRRHPRGAGRQDPCAARSRRAGALRHRRRLGARRPDARRPLRGARPLRRPFAARQRERLRRLSARARLQFRRSVERLRDLGQRPRRDKLSGWHMRNVHLPARVAEEHSETAYMTREAMRFVEDMGEQPWFLHLSYVKPHWPYMAPAPYHAHVRRRGLPAAQSRRVGASGPASGAGRLPPARGIAFPSSAPRRRRSCARPIWA